MQISMSRSPILAAAVSILTAAAASPAAAQGWIEPRQAPAPGVERIRSEVRIDVDAERHIARFTIREEFRNATGRILEGDYLYPVPPGAAFTGFSLFMGERELRGEMMDAAEARRIYEEIVRRRKDPALIELVGHGVLRARVFPIAPGETRRVILRYTQALAGDADLLRLRYPRIVDPVREAGRPVRPPARPPADPLFSLRVHVTGASNLATPYSPTHTIRVNEPSPGELEIIQEDRARGVRDFELILPLHEARIGASVLTHAPAGEDGYFMLLIAPPRTPEEIRIPRDLTLVLDVSGSMSGAKIEQARDALRQLLGGLRPDDRFRLVTFSNVVRSFRPDLAPATEANLTAAREFLQAVRAEGSTHIMGALEDALGPDAATGRLSVVVFLTDGKPTAGETMPERIVERVTGLLDGERVFAFGVGHDVNTYLIDRLVEGGRGSAAYVRPQQDVEAAIAGLGRKLRFPALSDLRIVDAPVELEDRHPDPLPDLFYGEELVVLGRYRGHGSGDLTLEGRRAGRTERMTYRVRFSEREAANDFIPRLWAARKAGALSARLRLHGHDPELVEELKRLGLRYGILTEYTSYLVEEPELAFGAEGDRELAERARRLSAAPAAQSGAASFDRADRSQRMRTAMRLEEAEVLAFSNDDGRRTVRPAEIRRVGDRLFTRRDGVWTDLRYEPSLPVVRIAPFGPAYFELVDRLPALRPCLALDKRVRIAADGLTLEIAPDAAGDLSGDELRRVLRAFQGPEPGGAPIDDRG